MTQDNKVCKIYLTLRFPYDNIKTEGGCTLQKTDNFRRGTVELAVLCVLLTGEKYGYQIVQEISERSGGLFSIPLGTLYPVLYRFSESGYISDRDEIVGKRLRKYYKLTESGKSYYDSLLEEYRNMTSGIDKITGGITDDNSGD